MKNLIWLSLLLSTWSFSQTSKYKPFPEIYGGWLINPVCEEDRCVNINFHRIEGDTSINGIKYSILREHVLYYNAVFENLADFSIYNGDTIFYGKNEIYFRNDITNKKVYILDPTRGDEQLWYDFNINLEIGDTLSYDTYAYQSANLSSNDFNIAILDSIDSVKICDDFHKRWNFSIPRPDESMTLIEGVGFTIGFKDIGPLGLMVPQDQLIDYFSNELCSKNNPTFNGIKILSSKKVNYYTFDFILYPNPAIDHINIKLDPPWNKKYNLKFFDMNGKLCQMNSVDDSYVKIDVSNLYPGIYALQIMDGEEIIFHKPLVILKD